MNFNGALQNGQNLGGFGVVLRDDGGRCIAALSRHLTHVTSTIHLEAEACITGLATALRLGGGGEYYSRIG